MTDAAVSRIYLDSTIFIDAFEGTDDQASALQHLFVRFRARRQRGVTSEFTLAEVLGKESGRGWDWQKRFYIDLIASGVFDLRPLSLAILVETGVFRRWGKKEGRAAKLPDAIHAVTARDAGCQYLFTTDKRFLTPDGVTVIAPDVAGFAAIGDILDA